MKSLQTTKQFKKDVKRLKRQGRNLEKLKTAIDTLSHEKDLEEKYRDHKLIGKYLNARECHLEPDWLLIYEILDDVVKLRRTGSHAELFK